MPALEASTSARRVRQLCQPREPRHAIESSIAIELVELGRAMARATKPRASNQHGFQRNSRIDAPRMQPGSRHPMSRFWRGSLRVLLPQDCAVCAAPTEGGLVCGACEPHFAQLAAHCPRCALPSPAGSLCGACISRPPHFDRTIAATEYAYPLDRLMRAYKYDAALAYAALFSESIVRAVASAGGIDLVVPMPLHAARLRERGFNQAHELARRVGRALRVPVDPVAATRIRATTVQADLSMDARALNVRNAFTASGAVMGRRVAVVDDVMTTGATLDELARTLKAHGALYVENWVVARALLNP